MPNDTNPHDYCTEVGPLCPVSATTYGYYPNLGGNAFLLAVFAICAITQLFLGVRYKLRAFLGTMFVGTGLEAAGYVGRILLNMNPWDQSGFKLQIVAIILAPSFLAAGIYLTLKHLVIHLGPEYSRMPAKWYPWIFIGCDVVSILTQAAGGGLAASNTPNLLNVGNDLIIAGISFQVFTMLICWILAIDFVVRMHKKAPGLLAAQGRGFLFYLVCSAIAFCAIFIRCVYRIPEMSGGWGSAEQRSEDKFLVLDGAMIGLASVLMTVAHPGIFFPSISSRHQKAELEKNANNLESNSNSEHSASE